MTSSTNRISRRGRAAASPASPASPPAATFLLLNLLVLAATLATPAAAAATTTTAARRALLQQSGFYHRVTDLHWRQTDFSVRNEQQTHMVLSALRRTGGDAAAANAVSTALLGSQNFEHGGDTHTRNNLMMNLQRYAKPGQGGALGAVYKRIHPRTFVTGDKDTDFRNNAWANVHLKETRAAGVRHDLAMGKARQAAYERYKRELTDVPRGGGGAAAPEKENEGGKAAAAAAGR